eukprot:gene30835-35874_t
MPPVPPWAETPTRVVIEFQKESGLVHRHIILSHRAGHLPQQLANRLPPELWSGLIQDLEYLASRHPFGYKAEEGSAFSWCGGYLCIVCISIGRIIGDEMIEYQEWSREANSVLQSHQRRLAPFGIMLSFTGYPATLGPVMMCAPMFAGPGIGPF